MTYTDEVDEPAMSLHDTPFDPFDVDAATETTAPKPGRIVVYGQHGLGKTTLASHFPNPIALFTEDGKGAIPIRSFPQRATEYAHVVAAISSILKKPTDRQTFVLDSLDWLEPIVWAETCARNELENIEAAGYGKGYLYADDVWAELFRGFDALHDAGFTVVLLAHSEITRFTPPDSEPYDRYDMALHKRALAMVHEWADVVGFAYEKVYTISKTTGKGVNAKTTTRASGVGGRFLALERTATHEAKNRFGLPSEIELRNDPSTAAELLGRIAHSYSLAERTV